MVHAMAQAVSQWRVTARPVHVEYVVDKVVLGQVFFYKYVSFPVTIIPPKLHFYSSVTITI
jgi:hypothetical protein